jgi:hypothetical protein
MPGVSGVTVVTNSYAFYFCMRGCGRIGRPAFPAPSDFSEGGKFQLKLARTCGEIAKLYSDVIARSESDEAIQLLNFRKQG